MIVAFPGYCLALGAALCMVASPWLCGAEPQANDQPGLDVQRALDRVPAVASLLTFDGAGVTAPHGGHLQGIQLRREAAGKRCLAYSSHDSETVAYLVVAQFPLELDGEGSVLTIHQLPSDGQSPPLRHAGGLQLAGDVLAVGVEDNQLKTRSEIQFWSIANAEQLTQLKHLTIRRAGTAKEQTAGAVGLVKRAKDHLLSVANWDCRAIDFYISNGRPLDDGECRFIFHKRWSVATAARHDWLPDDLCGAYQAINLIADANGAMFLLGFETTLAGADIVDLFAVDVNQEPSRLLRKIGRKPMKLGGENHFRYSGGLLLDGGALSILSSPRELGPHTGISIARPAR